MVNLMLCPFYHKKKINSTLGDRGQFTKASKIPGLSGPDRVSRLSMHPQLLPPACLCPWITSPRGTWVPSTSPEGTGHLCPAPWVRRRQDSEHHRAWQKEGEQGSPGSSLCDSWAFMYRPHQSPLLRGQPPRDPSPGACTLPGKLGSGG